MENQYPTSQTTFFRNEITPEGFIKKETLMAQNIYSCFQFAKIVVTKVEEIQAGKSRIILVADDEPLTFKLIEEFFHDADLACNILKAPNGSIAFTMAMSENPDLIITDWLMPELDGLDLIKHLKATPQTKD